MLNLVEKFKVTIWLHPHLLNVLGMQMRSHLVMQSSHVQKTTWLINKQINHHMANYDLFIK